VADCQGDNKEEKNYYAKRVIDGTERRSRRFIWRWRCISTDLDPKALNAHDSNLERIFPRQLDDDRSETGLFVYPKVTHIYIRPSDQPLQSMMINLKPSRKKWW
jgi:hypothetical protein